MDRNFWEPNYLIFLYEEGCIHQTTCVYGPQQNGVVERKHRHLLETARALKLQAGMLDCFWGECVLTATHIINRLPSPNLQGRAPLEVMFEKKPDFSHLRVFGCLCYITNNNPHKGKFDSRADPSVFLGYPFGKRDIRFLIYRHTLFRSVEMLCFMKMFFLTKIRQFQTTLIYHWQCHQQ